MENQKKSKLEFILIIIIIILIGGIVFLLYNQPKQNQEMIQVGYDLGVEATAARLFQLAPQCQPIPVNYDDQTLNLIAIDCLRR